MLVPLAVALLLTPLAVACGRAIDAEPSSPARTPAATPIAESPSMPPPEGSVWTPTADWGCDCGHDTLFRSVAEIIGRSHLIVIGTVEESIVGEVSDDDPEYPTINVHTTVAVEEALKGSAPGGEVIVPTLELAFTGNDEDWREPGHRVLLFLTPSRERDAPFFVLSHINYWQTVYFIDGDDIEPGSDQDRFYRLSEKVAEKSVPELRELVERVSG